MVVAVDGPGGVGKSTVARAAAEALGIAYLDTGAFYRAVTLAVVRAGIDPDDQEGAARIAAAAVLDFAGGEMMLDGESVAEAIRSPEVTATVSAVSAIPAVRHAVVHQQRAWVARHGGDAVVEGRDIGTVVFPEAPVKVFLTADPLVRGRRRAGDAEAADQVLEEIVANLEARDLYDSTRETSPLTPAIDAVAIDTAHLTVEEVVGIVLDLVAADG